MLCFIKLVCFLIISNQATAQCNIQKLSDSDLTVKTKVGSYTGILKQYESFGSVVKFLGVRYVQEITSNKRFQEATKLSPGEGLSFVKVF